VPDLEKVMEALNSKMSTIYDMIATLEEKDNPPPMERYRLTLVLSIYIYMEIE